ncbi:S8 family serine peptidase [Nonomuraea sp. NPDC059023]|uniref:S8 family peptidase n=1 Tax=unclassified Nonomuraea TaxID=2593643 RepID=UPI0036A8E8FD
MPLIVSSRRLAGAVAATALAATALAPLPAHASPETASQGVTVTLITGHQVRLKADAVSVERPKGATGGVQTYHAGGDVHVVPDEAAPLLAAGKLDPRLFNVTDLVEMGYDDARSGGVPMIATYQGAAPRSAPRGASIVRALPSVRGAALRAPKKDVREFWNGLATSGAAKIWLDGKARANLKESVPQVQAPAAWAQGLDGAGVKVAVLDSGVDATHPDLQGQIAEQASFVPGQEVKDANGHGTHVASTIAGTGAASSGANKGVAPGADLLVGKVLDDEGSGQDSWIIAGMEWAASKAGVVSMSLGSPLPDSGSDPMSLAVDELSKKHNTLFVIAAGNAYNPGAIGSPGSAASALTVAAVDKADQRAPFSSQGPLTLTYGLKPDISAPGVTINAARSSFAGGSGPYVAMDGTSMATPHVAGAAAILRQRHPDWTWQQLKDTLMSSAKGLDNTPYEQGTGRLDVAAAVGAKVSATGSVPVALFDWPHEPGEAPLKRVITYRNDGDAPATLNLTAQAPAKLSAPSVTVPAQGSATVELSVDPDGLEADQTLSGLVTATDGTITVRTAFAAVKERELYDLTLELRDRSGEPAAGYVVLSQLGDRYPWQYAVDGKRTLRLPPGSYMATSYLPVAGERADALGTAVLVDPEITLDKDTQVVLDAARARRVSAKVAQRTEDHQVKVDFYRSPPEGEGARGAYQVPVAIEDVYVSPTEKVARGSFGLLTRWRKGEPMLSVSAPGLPPIEALVQIDATITDGRALLKGVHAGKGDDYTGIDARGKAVIVERSDAVTPQARAAKAIAAGAKLLLVVNDRPGRLMEVYGEAVTIPVASLTRDAGAKAAELARKGRLLLATEQSRYADYLYDLVDVHPEAVPDRDLTYRPRGLARIDSTYYGSGAKAGSGYRYDMREGWGPAIGFEEYETFPKQRTEWVSTQPGSIWYENHGVGLNYFAAWEMRQSPRTYRPGERLEQEWFHPVARPRLGDTYWGPFRQTNGYVQFNITPWTDGGPSRAGSMPDDEYDTTSIALYQGDKLIQRAKGRAFSPRDPLPEAALPYRLVLDSARDGGTWRTSTRTRTEWGFTSGANDPDGPFNVDIPLLQLDYDVRTDLAGDVRGPVARIGLSGTTQEWLAKPVKATEATLQASFDDGATWQPVRLRPAGAGAWRADLVTLGKKGFVSLKATAKDGQGGTVSQEIIRAFGLR